MIRMIWDASEADPGLACLLDEVLEYAHVYVLARQRQKGCDGMGELATMKEEFRDVVDKVIQYSQEKEYISEVKGYDIDEVVDEIMRL
jgi:NTP pyrophosphatase (non-canonical NTP hydrolase)